MNWGHGGFSTRTQRLLVDVLLALRGEARRSPDPVEDRARAEALADHILATFPRRVIPIGAAALVALVVFSAMPLVRDALPGAGLVEESEPVAAILETSLRERGSAIGDGLEAIGSIVVPFAVEERPVDERSNPTDAPTVPASAEAPFTRS
jgi:hypothetical protein